MQAIWFWPNRTRHRQMAETLRHFASTTSGDRQDALHHERPGRPVHRDAEARLVRDRQLVGRIKECSYLGTPVVDIGGRQQGV